MKYMYIDIFVYKILYLLGTENKTTTILLDGKRVKLQLWLVSSVEL